MALSEAPFRYGDLPAPLTTGVNVVDLTITGGIRTKQDLLGLLARGLRFPEFYGGNWDAFEECIRDLSWLGEGRVVLRHEDIPLSDDDLQRTYLDILAGAVARHRASQGTRLMVTFPESMRTRVEALLDEKLGS